MLKSLLSVILLLTRIALSAQNAGVLDNGFGTNGIVTTTITTGQQNGIHKLLQQPDGKIIAIGNTNHYQTNSEIVVVRYNTNGSLDNSFGTGGIAIHSPGNNDNVQSGILQPDGKIILVGIKDYNSASRAIVMRLNSNGSIDNTFDGDGIMEIGPVTGSDNRFVDIERDASGNYFLCGYFDNGAGRLDAAVVKLTSSLAIDNSYGTLGIFQFGTIAGYDNYPGDISIQADGKVVGAGYSAGPGPRSPLIWRLTNAGAFDNSFAGTGWFHYSIGGLQYFTDVAIQSTGRIVAAGYEYFAGQPRVFGRAFDANGTEVNFHLSDNPSQFTVIVSMTLQDDDRFLLVGYNSATRNFYLSRHDADGFKQDINPDPLNLHLDDAIFGPSESDYGYTCLVQSDGKYVVGGFTGTGFIYESGSLQFGLARFAGLSAEINLPVHLLSFTAEKNGREAILTWQTSDEQNNSGFEVQRSDDGIHFTAIGWINSNRGNTLINQYRFIDHSPHARKNFYRLKQVDLDNRYTWSGIRMLDMNKEKQSLLLFPNPANDVISLSGVAAGEQLHLYDAAGKLLLFKKISGTQEMLEIAQLLKGVYLLRVTDNRNSIRSAFFIKQ